MKKKILCLLVCVICFSMLGTTAFAVKMYAPDGREADVHSADVAAWKAVGWYDYPVTTVYALDGRSAVISTTAVQAWTKVGWYEQPVTMVYAADGRTSVIALSQLEAWKAVGWYDYPVKTVFALDGRRSVIMASQLNEWKKVGWYESPAMTNDMITFYEGDWHCQGRRLTIEHLYDNCFKLKIWIPDESMDFDYWGYYWQYYYGCEVVGLLDANGVFHCSDGVIYYQSHRTAQEYANNISGTIELWVNPEKILLDEDVPYALKVNLHGSEYLTAPEYQDRFYFNSLSFSRW